MKVRVKKMFPKKSNSKNNFLVIEMKKKCLKKKNKKRTKKNKRKKMTSKWIKTSRVPLQNLKTWTNKKKNKLKRKETNSSVMLMKMN